MNITLREVYQTNADGDRFWKLKECYIRGSTVRVSCAALESRPADREMCARSNTYACRIRSLTPSRRSRTGRARPAGETEGGILADQEEAVRRLAHHPSFVMFSHFFIVHRTGYAAARCVSACSMPPLA